MFARDDGRVLRLYRNAAYAAEADRTIVVLRALRDAGVRVPEVFGREDAGDRPGVVMERIDGTDMLTEIGRKPWKVWGVGGLSGRAHAAMHQIEAPDILESNHDRLRRRITESALVPDEFRGVALARLSEMPGGDRLCHGDYHPGNLMLKAGEPVVIDWSNASRGVPEADVVRTKLMLDYGEPPPGTPVVIRVAAKVARKLLVDSYLGAYRRAGSIDAQVMKRWELPIVVARLTEGIPEERERLLKQIRVLQTGA